MIKHLRLFTTMLLLAVFGGMQAQDEIIDLSAQGYTNSQLVSSTSGVDCAITYAGGTTSATYYDTGTGVRIYGEGEFTVSSSKKSIVKLEFTFSGTNAPGSNGTCTVSTGAFDTSTMTWTSSSSTGDNSITFTREAISKHWRMQKIAVYYAASNDGRTATTLTFANPADVNYVQGDGVQTFTNAATLEPAVARAVINYSSDNEAVAKVDANGMVTVSNDVAGTAIIKATYDGDDTYGPSSASYKINVQAAFTSIADLKVAAPTGTVLLKLKDAQMVYVNGSHHYMQDATGAINLYNKNVPYTQGQILNGLAEVVYSPHNNLPQISSLNPVGDLNIVDGNAVPMEMSAEDAENEANLCKYIKMTGVKIVGGKVSEGTGVLELYDNFAPNYASRRTFTTLDGTFDLVAIPIVYNDKKELAIIGMDLKQTIGKAGYTTSYYSAISMVVPEGVTASTYKMGNGSATVSKEYKAGDVIPAGEAVVLNGAAGEYTFSVTTDAATVDPNNELKGVDAETALTADASKYFYRLSLNAKEEPGTIGFYWDNATGSAFTVAAHKTYITAPASAAAKSFYLLSETTGIEEVVAGAQLDENAPMFNLAGQRVGKNYRGVVVQNGKKYIVR